MKPHSVAGRAYRVTLVTQTRQPWLCYWPVAKAVTRELDDAPLWRGSTLHTWVLMPDHLHLLLTLGDRETLTQLIARVKAACAAAGCHALQSHESFWAPAFNDRALRDGEDLCAISRHLIANPIRAGLADDIWAWPFWRSRPLAATASTDHWHNRQSIPGRSEGPDVRDEPKHHDADHHR
ncbi:MAG TPA: transposase [Rhodanobacteraceae bacterium]|nr:transposase [Rhodanobacteraceae bacterium]